MDNAFQRYGNGGTASAMNPLPVAPRPETPIPAMLDEQEKMLYGLHGIIDQLEERLLLVLAPPPPATTGGGQKDAQPKSVRIISRVQDHTIGLQAAIERIHSLLGRVQV